MPNKNLDFFGSLIVSQIRNETIEQWQATLSGKMKDEKSKSFHAELSSLPPSCREFIEKNLSKIVDTTIFKTLNFFEQEQENIKLLVREESGNFIDIADESDGLAGELFGTNGWIAKFEKKQQS